MKKVLAVMVGTVLALATVSPAQAEAPLMSWDASGIKGVTRTSISCYVVEGGPWSTWRSDGLPVTGSWVYKSSGSVGIYPDYTDEVQCTIRAFSKNGKIVGYPAPVHWRFVP